MADKCHFVRKISEGIYVLFVCLSLSLFNKNTGEGKERERGLAAVGSRRRQAVAGLPHMTIIFLSPDSTDSYSIYNFHSAGRFESS